MPTPQEEWLDQSFESDSERRDFVRSELKNGAEFDLEVLQRFGVDRDDDRGAGFWNRVKLAVNKGGPEAKAKGLVDTFGRGNVMIDKGEIYIRESSNETFRAVDPDAFELTDVVEFGVANAGKIAGGIKGAAMGAALGPFGIILGGALGTGVGSAAEEVVSASMGDDRSMMDRAQSVGTDIVLDGATAGTLKGLGSVVRGTRQLVGKGLTGQLTKTGRAAAADAADDIALTGVVTKGSQQTGSRLGAEIEDVAGNASPLTRSALDNLRSTQVSQIKTFRDRMIDGMRGTSSPQTKAQLGERMKDLHVKGRQELLELRRTTSSKNYGEIKRSATKDEIYSTESLRNEVEKILGEMGDGIDNSVKNKLSRIRESLYDTALDESDDLATNTVKLIPRKLNVDDFRAYRQDIGDAIALPRETRKIIGSETPSATGIAIKLKQAIDIDEANTIRELGDNPIGALVKRARDDYASNSRLIDDFDNTALSKLLGKLETPEKIAKKIMGAEDSEFKAAIGILKESDPVLARDVQTRLMEDIFSKASGGGGEFSIPKLASALDKDWSKLSIITGDGGMKAKAEIMALRRTLAKIKGSHAKGSQTAGRMIPTTEATALLGTLFYGSGFGAVAGAVATKNIAAKLVMDAMLDPTGRGVLQKTLEQLASRKGAVPRLTELAKWGIAKGLLKPQQQSADGIVENE